jgi:hypothetical protein
MPSSRREFFWKISAIVTQRLKRLLLHCSGTRWSHLFLIYDNDALKRRSNENESWWELPVTIDAQNKLESLPCKLCIKNLGTEPRRAVRKSSIFPKNTFSTEIITELKDALNVFMHKLYNGLIINSILLCSPKQDKHFLLSNPLFILI